MASYSPQTRQAARAGSTAADWTAEICNLFGLAAAAVGQIGISAGLIFSGGFFRFVEKVTFRISEDPPRTDFESATRVRRPRARPEVFSREDETERAAVLAAEAADLAEAYLSAHLRAFERYQGARERDRLDRAQARRTEATTYAREGAGFLEEAAGHVETLRSRLEVGWDESWSAGIEGRSRVRRASPNDLPDPVLAQLYLGGLRIGDLEQSLRWTTRTPSDMLLDRLGQAPARFTNLASELRTWTPE